MRAIALEYHDIPGGQDFSSSGFSGAAADSYKLSQSTFSEHLHALRYRPSVGIRVTQVGAGRITPIFLTFDDGGISALHVAAKLLEENGFCGHFFMTTDQMDKPGFCGPEHLRELRDRGHLVGSHSHTHPMRMALLSDAEILREWRLSAEILGEILGSHPVTASVPGGYYSRRVASAASQAGIRYLFNSEPVTSIKEVDGCLVLGRFTLRRASHSSEIRSIVSPVGLARYAQWASWNGKKILKVAVGGLYNRLRESFYTEHP